MRGEESHLEKKTRSLSAGHCLRKWWQCPPSRLSRLKRTLRVLRPFRLDSAAFDWTRLKAWRGLLVVLVVPGEQVQRPHAASLRGSPLSLLAGDFKIESGGPGWTSSLKNDIHYREEDAGGQRVSSNEWCLNNVISDSSKSIRDASALTGQPQLSGETAPESW